MQEVDVAIVGYGPVGQGLAAMLGQRGWRTVVIEKQLSIFPLPRACHFDHEAMRIFQAMGIAEEMLANSVPAREYKLLKQDGSLLASLPRSPESLSGWESSYHFYQPDIESVMDRCARANPRVTVLNGVAAVDVVESKESVMIQTLDSTGVRENIKARYVIGADGANSLVRSKSEIPLTDLGFEATWLVVDVTVKEGHEVPQIPDTAQICDPRQPTHMAWLGGRHLRWEFMLAPDMDPRKAENGAYIWPRLERWVTSENAVVVRSSSYTFRSLIASTFNAGRRLLAGDAAHLMPPFMGQGMVSGLRDASTLAWILDLVLRDRASPDLLDDYTASRLPHVTEYIQESVRVGRIVCETDVEKARLRDEAAAGAQEETAPFGAKVGALTFESPGSGQLSPQPHLASHGNALLDDVVGSGFKLLSFDVEDLVAASGFREVVETLDLRVVLFRRGGAEATPLEDFPNFAETVLAHEQGNRLHEWLSTNGKKTVLIRPDGYAYGTASGAAEVADMFTSLSHSLKLTVGESRGTVTV